MMIQIQVSLPDATVTTLDSLVASGVVPDRETVIERGAWREIRRVQAERDTQLLLQMGDHDELASFIRQAHEALAKFDLDLS